MSRSRSVRATDPATSRAAARVHGLRWGSYRARALELHYQARDESDGLTDFEVIERSLPLGGLGDPSTRHKRVGELRTDFDPPLIERVMDAAGNPVERPGAYQDTPRSVWRISDAGRIAYLTLRSSNSDNTRPHEDSNPEPTV